MNTNVTSARRLIGKFCVLKLVYIKEKKYFFCAILYNYDSLINRDREPKIFCIDIDVFDMNDPPYL